MSKSNQYNNILDSSLDLEKYVKSLSSLTPPLKKEELKQLIAKVVASELVSSLGNALLIHAVKINQIDLVNDLINQGVGIDSRDETGNTALSTAIKTKHFDLMKSLVSQGASLDTSDNDGVTPYHIALESGFDYFKFLYDKNPIDVNSQLTRKGNSLLHTAIHYKNLDGVKFLLDNGANANHVNNHRLSILDFAIKHDHDFKIIPLIIEASIVDTSNQNSLYDFAEKGVKSNNIAFMKYLIDKGLDIDYNPTASNPELRAELSKTLERISKGISITPQEAFYGISVIEDKYRIIKKLDAGHLLNIAISLGHKNLAKEIVNYAKKVGGELVSIEEVIDTPVTSNICKYVFDLNRRYHDAPLEEQVETLFKEIKSNMSEVYFGPELLHLTCEWAMPDAAISIVGQAGARIDCIIDSTKTTPLMRALKENHVNMIKPLKMSGADIKAKDINGDTACHIAIKHGLSTFSQLMIQQAGHGEIDIKDLATKLKNNNGETLLHVAAGTTYPDAVRYLIEKGADRKAQDIHDRIPFDIAHNTHHIPEIEDLLSVTGDSSAL